MSKLKTSVEPSSRRGVVEEAFENVWGEEERHSFNKVTVSERQLVDIPLALLKPYNSNEFLNPDDVEKLAESILDVGLIIPIVVVKDSDGMYIILSGSRRFRAYEILNKKSPEGKFIKMTGHIVSREYSTDPQYLKKIYEASNHSTRF